METENKCSKIVYYIVGVVAALAAGLGVGVRYSREIKHVEDVVLYSTIKLDESATKHIPGNELWERFAKLHLKYLRGMSEEEIEMQQTRFKTDLEKRLEEYKKLKQE